MAYRDYKGRYAEIYLPSEKFLENWKAAAEDARLSLSSWIFETVEASLAGASEPIKEISTQNDSLLSENRKLRQKLEMHSARLRELETDNFKLRHASFLSSQSGEEIYSEKLVDILQTGGVLAYRTLMDEMGVNASDADAIAILSQQLQALQSFGLVQETARGWRWTG